MEGGTGKVEEKNKQAEMTGKQSIRFDEAVHLLCAASIAGKKEGEGPLGDLFDQVFEDPFFGKATWEEAESAMQRAVLEKVLEKAGMQEKEIRFLFGGNLLGQLIATSFGVKELEIPLFGLYGACSTCGEALCLAAMTVAGGFARPCGSCHQQSFWRSREAVSFSSGIRKSAASFRDLDSDRSRCFSAWEKRRKGEDPGSDTRKDCGLRSEGFSEYGSLYGSGSCGYH